MKTELKIAYEHYDSLSDLPSQDQQLLDAARRATHHENAPYSHFHVGAAVRLRSGKVLTGSNFESEVFPAGLCAERSVLFYVEANHAGDPIETMAIASTPAERECYPCGQCRQVLVDVERRQHAPIRVVMASDRTASVVASASQLLPFTFIL